MWTRICCNCNIYVSGMSVTPTESKLLSLAINSAKKRNQEYDINMEKNVVDIFGIVKRFIKTRNVLCYGGTAINAVLDEKDRFYDETYDLPDYDFFSMRAMSHAKELADMYAKQDYVVHAKAGQHYGTYKVYVNFLPVADITQCDSRIFDRLWKQKYIVDGIRYVPPNFLKWSMYLELSRPMGDVSRWDKVYQRLKLLEQRFPISKCLISNKNKNSTLNRSFSSYQYDESQLHDHLKELFIEDNVIFFGFSAYTEYMYTYKKKKKVKAADFEVISTDYIACANRIRTNLTNLGYQPIYTTQVDGIGEFVPSHYEVRLGQAIIAHIYESQSCYSYNVVSIRSKTNGEMKMKVASIETLLSFYFIFLYIDNHYNNVNRITCMAQSLLELQRKNLAASRGLLKRFPIDCDGVQKTKKVVMREKYDKFIELKTKGLGPGARIYDEWFFNHKIPLRKNFSATATNTKRKRRKVRSTSSRSGSNSTSSSSSKTTSTSYKTRTSKNHMTSKGITRPRVRTKRGRGTTLTKTPRTSRTLYGTRMRVKRKRRNKSDSRDRSRHRH